MNNPRLNIDAYVKGIRAGERTILAKAITLVESTLPGDQASSAMLIESITPYAGKAMRIGITGVPGVGKSTFIEALGSQLTHEGKKIAVLTIDPSSQVTRGSILGDKTRMQDLAKNPMAFIRPTAAGSILGGVAGKTREAILLCEAAGFDTIIVETVGVGQSEVAVRPMVDFLLLLMLAGAGDELQGIKKGIMEMADGVAITKADGDNILHASEAQAEYQHALHLYPAKASGWTPQVLTCSAFTGSGIAEVWNMIAKYKSITSALGYFEQNRKQQNLDWFRNHFEQLLKMDYLSMQKLKTEITSLEKQIADQKISVQRAAQQLLKAYHQGINGSKS